MPVYIVTGKLGSGKTLSMVGRLKQYVEAGKPVATNVDLNVRELVKRKPAASVIRLPDRPAVSDFLALGQVHATGREELNGCIVLDECGTWLNSRTFADKGRQEIIDWLLHSRKLGWDVFLIVQNVTLLDKQIRDALAEYVVVCRRLDRLKIPVVGRLFSLLTFGLVKGQMPKVHLAIVRYGMGVGSVHADTWVFRGKDLYAAYQTVQVISDASPGMHSLVWYETDAEIAARPPKPKPKLPDVARVMRLPVDRRVHWVKHLGVVG